MNRYVTVQTPRSRGEAAEANVERGPNLRGKQDDHTTAFFVITRAVQQSILTKGIIAGNEPNRVHITPIIGEVHQFVMREADVLKNNQIININEILAKLIDICPNALQAEISGLDIIDEAEKALVIIKIYEQYCGQNKNNTEFLSIFLALYGKFLFFQENKTLSEELRNTAKDIHIQAEKRAEELVLELEASYQVLKKTAPEIGQLSTKARQAIKETLMTATLPSAQAMHARKSIEDMLEPYIARLNKLAFSTFKPVGGKVSSRSRHAGGVVSSAMDNFAVACKAGNVGDAVTYMALLLDFYPLSVEELQQQEKTKNPIITGQIDGVQNARMETRAKHLALTRDNSSDVFSYVVARHWNHMCDAFPEELGKSVKIEEIKQAFIQHMLARWRYADLKPEKSATVPKGSTGFKQEDQEIKEKQGVSPDASRWEATRIDEAACRTRIETIISSYQISASLSPATEHYSPYVGDDDSFLESSLSLPRSPTQAELQEKLEAENNALKKQLEEQNAKLEKVEKTIREQESQIIALQQQSITSPPIEILDNIAVASDATTNTLGLISPLVSSPLGGQSGVVQSPLAEMTENNSTSPGGVVVFSDLAQQTAGVTRLTNKADQIPANESLNPKKRRRSPSPGHASDSEEGTT